MNFIVASSCFLLLFFVSVFYVKNISYDNVNITGKIRFETSEENKASFEDKFEFLTRWDELKKIEEKELKHLCTDEDLMAQRTNQRGYNQHHIWGIDSWIEYDYMKSTCWNSQKAELTLFKSSLPAFFINNSYFDDPGLKGVVNVNNQPAVSMYHYAYYLIANNDNKQARKLAGQLFNYDFSNMILWFLTVLGPFENTRILPKPYTILTANEKRVTPQMRNYLERILPYISLNVTRRKVVFFPNEPVFCARHTILLGYTLSKRVIKQNWYSIRLLRLHFYQALNIPICYSKYLKTRVTISKRAYDIIKVYNQNMILQVDTSLYKLNTYSSKTTTLMDLVRIYANTDILYLHQYEERFNIWFLRSFSVVNIIDQYSQGEEDKHFLFNTIADNISVRYRRVNATKEELRESALKQQWAEDRAFINNKYK